MTLRRGDPRLARLSLNQATTKYWPVEQAIDGCLKADIAAIGLWREPVAELGVERTAGLVREAGLRVSSLCRGGFLTVADAQGRSAALDDNRRAIDEAATLGAQCLVMVVGGLPAGSRDLRGARAMVSDAIATLVPYAAERSVRLALEPMHPMFCADRGVLSTLAQALDVADAFPVEHVGVVVDTFHVWWDPDVWDQIARAGARIASFQVGDFLTPLPPDVLLGRGMMGDGHVDFPPFLAAVTAAGYMGDIEVEIFNADIWSGNYTEVLERMKESYARWVLAGT